MSTFIWDIDITSTNGVTPYEIRQQLKIWNKAWNK